MAPSTPPRKRKRQVIAGSASWLALVAATSLGVGHAETVRAEIKLPREAASPGVRYRLVVQSYDRRGHLTAIPESAAPRGSAQRAVTADELVGGIRIDIIELGDRRSAGASDAVVVAWVEAGDADLEFDARRARPSPDSFFGAAAHPADAQPIEILLARPRRGV
jgi:hypothetical protein